ncbi:pilus assembly protein Flp/PilA [Litorimonas taeanensis]|uniref:Pilus assembly protein Flp/PilA n=1 Tax=Litorimonas taeanensis TaxID=568099 RepID=A0A420WMD9_9PROT|nr:Flp family type IVb pilin [Litorimonas taeanensis]RKQ72072.1 pilus assembly protein Flp/PilA [Litorimonas taeanensis]
MKYHNIFYRFLIDETGATAIEYAVIIALIAGGIISAAGSLGVAISGKFETAAESTGEAAADP